MAHDIKNEGGYKKPPKAFQFQKGRSGNPSGRPRKAQGIPELLGKIAKQKVLTKGNNGPQWMTKLEELHAIDKPGSQWPFEGPGPSGENDDLFPRDREAQGRRR
jgi:hypothetical protein